MNDALAVVTVPVGPPVIVVSGGVVSPTTLTIQVLEAGVGSVLPAASVAFTEKVCEPFASAVYEAGEVHAVKAAPSRLQANVEPASVDVNGIDASAVATVPVGPPVIVVSGGVVSATFTIQVLVAAEPSVLPAASVARTANVWVPFARPV